MEKSCGRFGVEDPTQEMDLPPGFRFHPTDEELITHYLSYKVLDSSFSAVAIAEVDMNKVEPWDLPWEARIGEKEWYFFCVRDKKYPTGMRTNRATAAGYWKATGKDKEIFRGKCLVGMKKTLVFYMGRAPKGLKTNWVSHEYRLEGEFSLHNLNKVAVIKEQDDWVICRVFQKSSGGKKVHISGMIRCNPPPLTDSSPPNGKPGTAAVASESGGYVHCFSNNSMMIKQEDETMMMAFNTSSFPGPSFPTTFPAPNSLPMQDPAVLRSWLASYEQQQSFKTEKEMVLSSVMSQEIMAVGIGDNNNTKITSVVSNLGKGEMCLEHQETPPSTTPVPQVFDTIWTY